jgi:MFS family permease
VLPLVGASLHAGTAALGIVLGAFLLGAGLLQLPGGFAALRWGSKNTCLAGLTIMGAACLATSVAPDVPVLVVLRFAAGAGAAFVFAPGLSLISQYFPPGERGPVIGWYNGAFSIGGAAGLFGGAAAGVFLGWPFALGIGGAVQLLAAVIVWRAVPADAPAPADRSPSRLWQRARGVLRSRSVWALAFALTGFWSAVYIVAQFLVQYAHDARPDWGVGVAASLAGGVVLLSFPGGPVGGWLGEKARDRRVVAAVFGGLTGLLVLAVPFAPLVIVVPALLALGFFDGLVFAVQYLMPSYFPESRSDGLALGIAFLNSVQVLVGSGIAILFGFVVVLGGYPIAWIMAAAIALATLPLLVLVERQPSPTASVSVAAHSPARPG